jgi:hypothetical protein
MKNFCTLVLLLSFLTMGANAPNGFPEGLKQAFKTGNAHEIAKYFGNAVEIGIPGKDDVYNKTVAEQVLSIFFTKNPVVSFQVLYEGGKGTNQYAIGKLSTAKGIYRASILFKDNVILQLRIEEDNGN